MTHEPINAHTHTHHSCRCHIHEWVWVSHGTHVNVSCHTCECLLLHYGRCHIHEWVMSHMNESCLIWMSHVSYEWVMSHMNESCLIWMSRVSFLYSCRCHIHEWVMSHTQTSHFIYIKESCHINRVISHTSSLIATHPHCNTLQHTATHYNTLQHTTTHYNTLQHTATHYNMSHIIESRHIHKKVMAHTWKSHVTYTKTHVTVWLTRVVCVCVCIDWFVSHVTLVWLTLD